jgi:hypothetical protein
MLVNYLLTSMTISHLLTIGGALAVIQHYDSGPHQSLTFYNMFSLVSDKKETKSFFAGGSEGNP